MNDKTIKPPVATAGKPVDERILFIETRVTELAKEAKVTEVAKALTGVKNGQYVTTLVALLSQGIEAQTVAAGYVVARAMEFAARPSYKSKDGAHVLMDVRKHAANHIVLARAKMFQASEAAKIA